MYSHAKNKQTNPYSALQHFITFYIKIKIDQLVLKLCESIPALLIIQTYSASNHKLPVPVFSR